MYPEPQGATGGHNLMARMLGERLLPESVNSRRRQLRERVRDVREPVRSKRMDLVPGPNLLGKAETTLSDLRDSVVERESILSKIKARRSDGNGESEAEMPSEQSSNQAPKTTSGMT